MKVFLDTNVILDVLAGDELSAAWELLRRGINPPEIAPLSR